MYLKMVQIRQSIAVHADGQVYVHESLQGLHIAMMHQLSYAMQYTLPSFCFHNLHDSHVFANGLLPNARRPDPVQQSSQHMNHQCQRIDFVQHMVSVRTFFSQCHRYSIAHLPYMSTTILHFVAKKQQNPALTNAKNQVYHK